MADIYSSAKRAEIMSRVRGRDTRPERTVRSVLHGLGLRFRLNVSDLPGRRDVVLRRLRTVVFVHGCYWHGHDCSKGRSKAKTNAEFWNKKIADNRNRDAKNLALLKTQGWRTVVVWECETNNLARLRSELAEELGE
jgi:DNA mismatch endonuclease (patch repair protein)